MTTHAHRAGEFGAKKLKKVASEKTTLANRLSAVAASFPHHASAHRLASSAHIEAATAHTTVGQHDKADAHMKKADEHDARERGIRNTFKTQGLPIK